MAENGIFLMKKRLYSQMRTLNNLNWPSMTEQVAENLNKMPNKAIGNLRPIDIVSPIQDVLIDDKLGGWKSKQPPYQEMILNQQKYERNPKLIQAGDYVYARTKA